MCTKTYYQYHPGKQEYIAAKQAKRVVIEGFEEFHFFRCRNVCGKGWVVVEATTGMLVVDRSSRLIADVVDAAQRKVGSIGLVRMRGCIEATMNRRGCAPGWDGGNQ